MSKLQTDMRKATQSEKDEIGKMFGNYNGNNVTIGGVVDRGQMQVNIPREIRDDPKKLAEFMAFVNNINKQ